MLFGRHRRRLDELRARFDRRPGRPSSSLVEAEARLASVIERHLAELDEERGSLQRLSRAFDLIPQGFVLAAADGEIVFRNRGASGFVDARHGEALVESAIAELVSAAVDGHAETRTIDLFGPPRRAVELRAGPLRNDEESVGAFVLVEDVSDRQRLEAVRRDFVANISHELKTPIGAIGVLAESLASAEDPEAMRRLAERVEGEAFRVASTIDDLLELSRIEIGTVPEHEDVAVDDVIDDAIERSKPAAALRDVSVVRVDGERGLTVHGDRRQLVSALTNLIDNAVKYSDSSGAEVRVGAARADGRIDLSVADDGVGIPARDLERVFERFYRVDRARSRDTGGTGLGLAIVRHVVSNHHGEVTVTSREGEGSCFVLRLPDLATEPDRPPTQESP